MPRALDLLAHYMHIRLEALRERDITRREDLEVQVGRIIGFLRG